MSTLAHCTAPAPPFVACWLGLQVWYRFLGLEAARLPSLPTKQQRERARWQAIKAQHAADAGAGGSQQQQQQRKRPRYVEEDDLDDLDDLDDKRVEASGRNKGWGARQQQQQQHRPPPGGRLTRGRQQPQQQQQQYFGHSSRAAATKAAAAIAQQSRALTGGDSVGRGRRGPGRDSDFDDEFDDFDRYGSLRLQRACLKTTLKCCSI